MTVERRLRNHFEETASRLAEPPGAIEDVRRRGRRRRVVQQGAAALAATVVVLVGLLAITGLPERARIDFAPADPAPADPVPDSGVPADPLELGELGAPVLAYGEEGLRYVDGPEDVEVWPTRVVHAISDGRELAGVVLQTAADNEHEGQIVWVGSGGRERTLGTGQGLQLRGLLPDGRVLYSATPAEVTESSAEDFYAVALLEEAGPAAPELLDSIGAYESFHVGPAWPAAGEPVHAACHLMCSIWRGLAREQDEEPLYSGGVINGLSTTPDGRLVVFVEFELSPSGGVPVPELVVLDGATFAQVSRLALPHEETDVAPAASVSVDGTGRRILVTLGAASPTAGPNRPYLVTDAPGPAPRVRPIRFDGVVRWAGAGS
jgi:hypothetical protein